MLYQPLRDRHAVRSLLASIIDGAWRFAGALLCLLAIAGAGRAEAATTPELVHSAPVAPWVFCGGFEALAHTCSQPRRFD